MLTQEQIQFIAVLSNPKMSYVQELRSLIGHRPLIIAGAAVLIFDQQHRLLLQHRKDNHQWGLIGGSLEIGESLEQTARREVFEETGLELDQLEWFGVFSGQDLIYEYPKSKNTVRESSAFNRNC